MACEATGQCIARGLVDAQLTKADRPHSVLMPTRKMHQDHAHHTVCIWLSVAAAPFCLHSDPGHHVSACQDVHDKEVWYSFDPDQQARRWIAPHRVEPFRGCINAGDMSTNKGAPSPQCSCGEQDGPLAGTLSTQSLPQIHCQMLHRPLVPCHLLQTSIYVCHKLFRHTAQGQNACNPMRP